MTVPDLADPRPPYQQISADLRRRIRKGDPAAGDKLPSNKALAGQYGTSTETIRRALRVLTDEGLIKAHSTMGTFVMRAAGEPAPDVPAQLAELRGELVKLSEQAGDGQVLERIGRIEANLMDLYAKLGYEYPGRAPARRRRKAAGS